MNDYIPHTPQPPQHAPQGGSGAGLSLISAVIGGAIVAAVMAVLVVTGVIGSGDTVVQSNGIAASTANASGPAKTVGAIYKQAAPGVVSVRARVSSGQADPFGGPQDGQASGTGFLISKDGYIVTNHHVVENHQGDVRVTFKDDKTVSGQVIGQDPSSDIAVIKVKPDDHKLEPLELGDSDKVAVGDPVVAIGSPFGLDQTATTGIISALQRTITAPNNFSIDNVLQTDAAINPGNSGGPLLNDRGQVIGVNSQIATSGGTAGNVGIGFAVPINKVKQIVPDLEKHGKVQYAYLGVTTATLESSVAERLKLGAESGAIVACVVRGGPAGKAGLSAGGSNSVAIDGMEFNLDADIITKIDGKDVRTSTDVQKVVLEHKPGDSVKIETYRDGKKKSFDAKLDTRPTTTDNNCNPRSSGR